MAALGLLVVLAGCSALFGGDGATPDGGTAGLADGATPAGPPNVSVANGTLRSDPGRVYERLRRLRGVDAPVPTAVRVRNLSALPSNDAGNATDGPEFDRLGAYLNVSTAPVDVPDEADLAFNGRVTANGAVELYFGENASADTEHLALAHELVHYLQLQSGQWARQREAVDVTTTDGAYAARSLREGDAVFTTDYYVAAYAASSPRNAPIYRRIESAYPPGHARRYSNSRYTAGLEYVRWYVDEPAGVERLYEFPPTTSEQILHRLAPGSEPPVALSVAFPAVEGWHHVGRDRKGEAYLRYALASEIGFDRAVSAATGWGNDTLAIYRSGGDAPPGYAWAIRWDDAESAATFEAAAADAFDELGASENGTWALADHDAVARIERPTSRTVVVLVGADSFVRPLSVDGEGARVAIRAG